MNITFVDHARDVAPLPAESALPTPLRADTLMPALPVDISSKAAPRPAGRRVRREMGMSHELGHHLLRDPYSRDINVHTSQNDREQLINAFTEELLLPETGLHDTEAGRLPRANTQLAGPHARGNSYTVR